MTGIEIDHLRAKRQPSAAALASAEAIDLRYRLLPGDLILRVGDVDLSARWGWIPLGDAAAGLAHALGTLRDQNLARYEFTESDASVLFERRDDKVEVSTNYTDGRATVPLPELVEAVSRFVDRAEQTALARVPGLAANGDFRQIVDSARRSLSMVRASWP